jgi:hypothetical protein
MVAVPSTGASRYHNCCVDGGTSPKILDQSMYNPSIYVWVSKRSLSLRFPHQNPVYASPLPHTRYMSRPSPRFYHPTILGEEYRSLSSSLCSFLHSPVPLRRQLYWRTKYLRNKLITFKTAHHSLCVLPAPYCLLPCHSAALQLTSIVCK